MTEVAPGIDIDRDILAHMAFRPIVRSPKPMDPRIFLPEPMGMDDDLIDMRLEDRIAYDPAVGTLFLNFEGLNIRGTDDVRAVHEAVEARCKAIGERVRVIVNYDNFTIDDRVIDDYAAMVRYLVDTYYSEISRYTTSAFMRLKLGEAIERRGVPPHIFERQDEAQSFLEDPAR